MKPVPLLLLTFLLFAGCKKGSHQTNDAFEGTWELRQIVGNYVASYPPGNGNLLKLEGDQYEIYADDTLRKKGTYSIITDRMPVGMTCVEAPIVNYHRIVYDGKIDSTKESIEVSGDSLKLVSGCFADDSGVEKQFVKK